MKTTLIILNLLAALLVLPVMALIHADYVTDVSRAYTALDREQIIDQGKLKQSFPHLVENDRHNFALWACGGRKERMLGVPCMVGFILNAVLIGLLMQRRTKPNQASHAPSGSATGTASSEHGG